MARKCRWCSKYIKGYRKYNSALCYPCSNIRSALMSKRRILAYSAVSSAIQRGALPPAKTQRCVDCGDRAFCYDHRDYRRPLDVSPVCKGCDCMRGPGRPYPSLYHMKLQITAARRNGAK